MRAVGGLGILAFALGLAGPSAAAGGVRGVAPEEQATYTPSGSPFTCRDGSARIPAERVNDDFCDCADGSDEPGTSACMGGRFYCANSAFFGEYIPSSRVRDGLCDCCDGSDEADHPAAACADTCAVKAEAALKEYELRATQLRAALRQKQTWADVASATAKSEESEAAVLETEAAAVDADIANVTARLSVLEEAERQRKEAEEEARRVVEEAARQEREAAEAAERAARGEEGGAADPVPGDQPGASDFPEQTAPTDRDEHAPQVAEGAADGAPALDNVDGGEPSDAAVADSGGGAGAGGGEEGASDWHESWMRVDPGTSEPSDGAADMDPEAVGYDEDLDDAPADWDEDGDGDAYGGHHSDDYDPDADEYEGAGYDPDEDDYAGGDYDPDDDDDDEYGGYPGDDADYEAAADHGGTGDAMGDNGESGQIDPVSSPRASPGLLASALKWARAAFPGLSTRTYAWWLKLTGQPLGELAEMRELKRKLANRKTEVDKRLREIRTRQETDYGDGGAFRPLHGQCLTTKSAQYTYELCPFDKVTQKEGGRVVARLGGWEADSWAEGRTAMVYKNGDRCWSGPARETTVTLECGLESAVHTVSEPEMCKYAMVFATAAACGDGHLAEVEKAMAKLAGGGNDESPKDEL